MVSSSRSNGAPIYKRPLVPEGTEGAEPCVSSDVIGMSGNGRYVGKSVLVHVVQLAEPPERREPLSDLETVVRLRHLCAARCVPWRLLPTRESGCGSGVTCWRRLRDWQAAGVWEALHHRLLDWLGDDGQVDWSRAAIDSVRCGRGVGELTGANPVDRGKAGSKYHLLIDATGLPLAVGLSAVNTHDSQLLEPLVDAVPAVFGPRGRPGRPRRRPAKLHGDKGYDYLSRRLLRRRGMTPRIARRGVESSTRLGWHRWKVERPWLGSWPTGAWWSAMSAAPTSLR